jgi:hypothetical protein
MDLVMMQQPTRMLWPYLVSSNDTKLNPPENGNVLTA